MMQRQMVKHGLRVKGSLPLRGTSSSSILPQCTVHCTRSFMSSTGAFASRWLRRAKVVHVVGRTMVAYPELLRLMEDDSLVGQYFVPDADIRERVFMYTFCLLPPDAPIEIPVFLQGAQLAAQAVHQELFELANEADHADKEVPSRLELSDVACDQCLDVWKTHESQLKRRLKLPESARLMPDRLEIKSCGLAKIDYVSSNVEDGEKNDEPRSIFGLNESVRINVRYEVTERVRTEDQTDKDETLTCDSIVEWTFESNVSRDELIDWVIVKATPFREIDMPAATEAKNDQASQ